MIQKDLYEAERVFAGEYDPTERRSIQDMIESPRKPRQYGRPSFEDDADMRIVFDYLDKR